MNQLDDISQTHWKLDINLRNRKKNWRKRAEKYISLMKWKGVPYLLMSRTRKKDGCGAGGEVRLPCEQSHFSTNQQAVFVCSPMPLGRTTKTTVAHSRQYGSRSLHIALLQCIFNFKAYLIKRFSLNSLAPKSKFEKGEFWVFWHLYDKNKEVHVIFYNPSGASGLGGRAPVTTYVLEVCM